MNLLIIFDDMKQRKIGKYLTKDVFWIINVIPKANFVQKYLMKK